MENAASVVYGKRAKRSTASAADTGKVLKDRLRAAIIAESDKS